MLKKIIITVVILLSTFVEASCPPNGHPFSMIFPVQAIVISENKDDKIPYSDSLIIIDVLIKTLGKNSPIIVFIGSTKNYFQLMKKLEFLVDKKILQDKLVNFNARSARWVQDVFESFYLSQSNSVLIRQFEGWSEKNNGTNLGELPRFLSQYSIKSNTGSFIEQKSAWSSGVGGNVEGVSFGISIIGKGEFSDGLLHDFIKNIFPDENSVVILDTSWLALGHIDEIVVEIKSENIAGKCYSTFLINSPREALKYFNLNKNEKAINNVLQRKFDVFKEQIIQKSSKLCQVNFIEVPMLYRSAKDYKMINEVGTRVRKVNSTAFPNLINGLLVGEHYFVVDIDNKKIRQYFEKALASVGLKVIWIPLRRKLYSNGITDGYLHCLTNTIRKCN